MKKSRLIVGLVTFALAGMIAVSTVYAGGKVNINTSSKWRLQKLPGVGETIAERIIDYRREVGHFNDLSELKKISGIGEKRYNDMKKVVTLGWPSERSS